MLETHALFALLTGRASACYGVAFGEGRSDMLHSVHQIRLAKGVAEELLAQAEAVGAVELWQEPTSLRQRWRDAGYAAAWAPGEYWASGEAAAADDGVFAGWASAPHAI